MKPASEGYLPLAQPGGYGQVDFGESLYYDGQGKERRGYALTVSFPQSNKGYTQFFPSQNQECLLTGLQRIFEHIGGVPPRLRFDNLSTVVAQVLEGWQAGGDCWVEYPLSEVLAGSDSQLLGASCAQLGVKNLAIRAEEELTDEQRQALETVLADARAAGLENAALVQGDTFTLL